MTCVLWESVFVQWEWWENCVLKIKGNIFILQFDWHIFSISHTTHVARLWFQNASHELIWWESGESWIAFVGVMTPIDSENIFWINKKIIFEFLVLHLIFLIINFVIANMTFCVGVMTPTSVYTELLWINKNNFLLNFTASPDFFNSQFYVGVMTPTSGYGTVLNLYKKKFSRNFTVLCHDFQILNSVITNVTWYGGVMTPPVICRSNDCW